MTDAMFTFLAFTSVRESRRRDCRSSLRQIKLNYFIAVFTTTYAPIIDCYLHVLYYDANLDQISLAADMMPSDGAMCIRRANSVHMY
jgi:hypothetical protein